MAANDSGFLAAQFQLGLRLDQYMASLKSNKETFRANFMSATACLTPEILGAYRRLPVKVRVMGLVNDDDPDTMRDMPVISRLSVEVGTILLRFFRAKEHFSLAGILSGPTPAIAFLDDRFNFIGTHIQRTPALAQWMEARQAAWLAEHPEASDLNVPINRVKLQIATNALTPQERIYWGEQALQTWLKMMEQYFHGAASSQAN
ncbi:MAG TPA: hypothetical protein PLJ62_14415 [Thermoflexales bacterium]|nr:hypothetical protein [Thermoflexales bacterium]HQW36034.1 hypothetical protein [Thermoflexales bacterium]HRA01396.1 hypothetical protein [Thermoflexales bacterium]